MGGFRFRWGAELAQRNGVTNVVMIPQREVAALVHCRTVAGMRNTCAASGAAPKNRQQFPQRRKRLDERGSNHRETPCSKGFTGMRSFDSSHRRPTITWLTRMRRTAAAWPRSLARRDARADVRDQPKEAARADECNQSRTMTGYRLPAPASPALSRLRLWPRRRSPEWAERYADRSPLCLTSINLAMLNASKSLAGAAEKQKTQPFNDSSDFK